jgi:pyridoxine 5-phosphate synthase
LIGMIRLGVNIDHVATLRQARYVGMGDSPNCEPSVVEAAEACERAGAHGITVHLRADRRHIQDADVFALRDRLRVPLNLEMGNTPEIVEIALRVRPDEACLVPEERREVTTEGGLDVAGLRGALAGTVGRLREAGVRVSLFIEPSPEQIDAAAELGAEVVELHTGAFANAVGAAAEAEWERLRAGAERAAERGLVVNAGHGINYANIVRVRALPSLDTLNIGHSIVSRAVGVGMERAVREMLSAMNPGGAA